jgi:hypothetical protein
MAHYSNQTIVSTTSDRRFGKLDFGKLDLTAGYHQAPLDEASRVYTAF